MKEVQLDMLGPEVDAPFPPTNHALQRPNGLLAWGGGLEPERLLHAYSQGIFPWYSKGEPIMWWTPNPRCVLLPDRVHLSSRTRRRFNSGCYRITADSAFAEVMDGCAEPRNGVAGTWITEALKNSFVQLHEQGFSHSVEVWQEQHLVGGIYGMALGKVFFGESMFSRRVDASKIALVALCKQLHEWSFELLDCQVTNPHLLSMGAEEISRDDFQARIAHLVQQPFQPASWKSIFKVADRW